jgi:hypothetical protein
MRCFVSALLLVLSAVPARAGDTPAALLTPQEVADGWLLLFDGATTFGWKIDGSGAVEKDGLRLGGDKITEATFTTPFSSFELRLAYRVEGPAAAWVRLSRGSQGTSTALPKSAGNAPPWDEVRLQVEFNAATATHTERATFAFPGGGGGTGAGSIQGVTAPALLRVGVPAGSRILLHSVTLRPTGLKSIFNGKDLSGWKEFPNKKSKFTVNERGELTIKNGPGDLQTERQWGDFVLQLECRSNGPHLNSGVFFRCRPGEYQNGYEAQIRNQFTAEPTQAYTIEDYDPQTHKLIGKKKIMATAVDYGTGAIYRRRPARKEMSKDHEWFTMTVAASGNHFATWVNGYQEVDWDDNRPPADNARNGFRRAAGPISLQGHDPTTDLSFRNFRIAELPAAGQ